MRRAAVVGGLCVGLAIGAASPAAAEELTGSQFRGLAQQARTDPDALERLRQVERVDERPVDVERALENAEGDELDARLRALARDVPIGPVDAEAVRLDAREILQEPQFQPPDVPRPFRGLLEQVADGLQRAWAELVGRTPGTGPTPWVIGAVFIVAAAAVIASLIAHRRGTEHAERRSRIQMGSAAEDPRTLEREAAEAERTGDLERAIRLLFRAGLLRLEARGTIDRRLTLTTGELSRRLRSRSFDEVAWTFEEIVYGGRPPRTEDVDASRTGWSQVLEGAGRP